MKHFLEISQITYDMARALILRALEFKRTKNYPSFKNHSLINLFYENSTRTKVSFALAANNLSLNVVDLDLEHSSEKKGESVEDTIHSLAAMGVDLFVVRHPQNGFARALAGSLHLCKHIINAGDGTHSHPTQAMLDLMTIIEHKPDLQNLKIAIVGDILHSRVANSLQTLCALLGVGEVVLVAPDSWLPVSSEYARITSSLQDGLQDADVVVTLRVQHERIAKDTKFDLALYRSNYAITDQSIKYAKPEAMIMHPGPINRGVEIDSDIADGDNSYILNQVENGIYMRMAIIESLLLNQDKI